MKILEDLKSLLNKGSTLGVAVAFVFGYAVYGLVETVNNAIVDPLLNMITGGGAGIHKLDVTFFGFGSLIQGIVHFAVALAVIYAVFILLLPKLGAGSTDEKPAPPPPAPPVV